MTARTTPGTDGGAGRTDDVELVVALGTGLLDEPVAATGTLGLALAGLRRGLLGGEGAVGGRRGTAAGRDADAAPDPEAGPDAGPEVDAASEVEIGLGTDVVTLTLRGPRGSVLAALRRLPDAFDPAHVPDDLEPVAPEHPLWPADLVQRAGHAAAALAALRVTAPDAVGRARDLLPGLDPRRGDVRLLFAGALAADPEVVAVARQLGAVDPVRPEPHDEPGAWADGTPRLPDPVVEPDRSATATTASGSRPGTLQAPDAAATGVLLSALVPRCAAGLAAADLLLAAARDAVDRARGDDAAAGGDATAGGDGGPGGLLPSRVQLGLLGLGPHLLLVLHGDRAPGPGVRRALVDDLAAAVDASAPDIDLVAAVRAVDAGARARAARDRLVLGLVPEAADGPEAVRWSLGVALASVHVPADDAPVDLPHDVDLPEAGPGLAWTAGSGAALPGGAAPGAARPVGATPVGAAPDGAAPGDVGAGRVPALGDDTLPALPPLVQDAPLGRRRLFRAWSRLGWGDAVATRTVHVVVGDGLVVAGRLTGDARRPSTWSPVDLGRLLAVVSDAAGTVTLVDGSLRLVPVHPRLFRRSGALRAALARATRAAPHLVVEGGTDAGQLQHRVRRDRAATVARTGLPAAAALAAVVALGVAVAPEPEVVQSRVEIGQEVDLHGGGTMTVLSVDHVVLDGPVGVRDVGGRVVDQGDGAPLSDLVRRGSGSGQPERLLLRVEACADRDDVDVSEGSFWAYGRSESPGSPIPTDDPLPAPVLEAGTCASGLVAFEGAALDEPKVGHETADENSVWYQPGQVHDPTSR